MKNFLISTWWKQNIYKTKIAEHSAKLTLSQDLWSSPYVVNMPAGFLWWSALWVIYRKDANKRYDCRFEVTLYVPNRWINTQWSTRRPLTMFWLELQNT